jgi:Tetrapyrrole (Corrin/Porphyrin) Methylases
MSEQSFGLQQNSQSRRRGSLVVVGTGIQVGHLTLDARAAIITADRVLYCVADVQTEWLLNTLNPRAESLRGFYADDKLRIVTYRQMIDRTLECVRAGERVCAVYYGHPGIFVYPSHESIKKAQAEGYQACMLPAVSSLDCLFADLGIDPASGCQIFEATDLLLRGRRIDPTMLVIIWQIGCVGDIGFNSKGYDGRHLPTLVDELARVYEPNHVVTVYEAAQYWVCDPVVKEVRLADLPTSGVTWISTLVIYPATTAPVRSSMVSKLGLEQSFSAASSLVSSPNLKQ